MMYQPFLVPEQAPARESQQQSFDNKCPDIKRPASQATSVKAESGSTMAMSESSKKVKRSTLTLLHLIMYQLSVVENNWKKLLYFILLEF